MTLEEYEEYSIITTNLFNYMNGRVNQLNKNCNLIIDPFDYINRTYGYIKYPNVIFIHIGNIIDDWNDAWSIYINKKDYIGSCIAWAIAHELHHADQLISMIEYNRNTEYRDKIERDVEKASYDWVNNNALALSAIGGFNVSMTKIESSTLATNTNYTKASPREYYLQTIANIVIRDLELFDRLAVFTNENMCEDMILIFNNSDTVVIKSNSRYLYENIGLFSKLVYKYCGKYHLYHIMVEVVFSSNSVGRRMATVYFNIEDQLISPMQFKD